MISRILLPGIAARDEPGKKSSCFVPPFNHLHHPYPIFLASPHPLKTPSFSSSDLLENASFLAPRPSPASFAPMLATHSFNPEEAIPTMSLPPPASNLASLSALLEGGLQDAADGAAAAGGGGGGHTEASAPAPATWGSSSLLLTTLEDTSFGTEAAASAPLPSPSPDYNHAFF